MHAATITPATNHDIVHDLCHTRTSHLHLTCSPLLQNLDTNVHLIFQQDPTILLHSLNLQWRRALHWQLYQDDSQRWHAIIQRREHVTPQSILDRLSRDHQRLDRLFGLTLQQINEGNITASFPYIHEFSIRLQRHINVENNMLAPAFHIPNPEPVEIMLREHDDILAQIAHIEVLYGHELPNGTEIGAFLSILSGGLAKHEYREEENLFPQWDIALNAADSTEKPALLWRIDQMLQSS